MKQIVVLGGGIGGLSAGWLLSKDPKYRVTVIEKGDAVGGVCATFDYKNSRLDYGPHKFYSTIPGVMPPICDLMGKEFMSLKKGHSIFLFNSYLRYPVQIGDLLPKMGLINAFQTTLSIAPLLFQKSGNLKSYESFMKARFGGKIYSMVFEPLASKVWGDPATLSADIARARIPGSGFFDVLLRAIGIKKESKDTTADYFFYPKGGFGRIAERMKEEIQKNNGIVNTNCVPKAIRHDGKAIHEVDVKHRGVSKTIECDMLISSIHLDELVRLLYAEGDRQRKDLLSHAGKLEYRNAILVYLETDREHLTKHHWIFVPDKSIIFNRVFEQSRLDADMIEKGKSILCCDLTDYENGPLYSMKDDELIRQCIDGLEKMNICVKGRTVSSFVKRIPRFYPRYGLLYRENLTALVKGLAQFANLLPTGRIGFYNYNNIDHCFDMARLIEQSLANGIQNNKIADDLLERVLSYRIVD